MAKKFSLKIEILALGESGAATWGGDQEGGNGVKGGAAKRGKWRAKCGLQGRAGKSSRNGGANSDCAWSRLRGNSMDPPRDILTRYRNPDFRTSPTMLPEIADFRGGPKSGDLWAGRLSNAGPRRSAQLVDYPTPLWPETPSKIRDRDAKKRARPAATPRARFFWEGGKKVLPGGERHSQEFFERHSHLFCLMVGERHSQDCLKDTPIYTTVSGSW